MKKQLGKVNEEESKDDLNLLGEISVGIKHQPSPQLEGGDSLESIPIPSIQANANYDEGANPDRDEANTDRDEASVDCDDDEVSDKLD